jgi:glycosyltransferase involved in cell wall biosynthesis
MKIIYYSPNPWLNLQDRAGYGTHMREMINAFKRDGHDVFPVIMGGVEVKHIAANSNDTALTKTKKKLLKKFIPNYIWQSLKDIKLLRLDSAYKALLIQKIYEIKPDFIYERTAYLQRSGVGAANFTNTKHISEINSPYQEEKIIFEGKSIFHALARRIEAEQIVKTNLVCTVSTALKDYFVKRHDFDSQKILVTPNAINPDSIKLESDYSIIEKYNLQNCFVFGFVGSIFEHHGVNSLISAFSKLVVSVPQRKLRLLIVGSGEPLEKLKQQADNFGLSDKVIFTGSVPHSQVYNHIDVMDVCVLARSNWYGSPIKIFEYGALGKAIVAPDIVPVKDVVEHEEHAILCGPEVDQIMGGMLNLLENPMLGEKIASNFKQKINDMHTWGKTVEIVLSKFPYGSG